MPSLPTTKPTKPSGIVSGQKVKAEHVSPLWDEFLTLVDMVGLSPTSIQDNIAESQYNSHITNNGIGGVLDVFASIIKRITGISWNGVLTGNIVPLQDNRNTGFVVKSDSDKTNYPNSASIADVVRTGTLASIPQANSVPQGTLYYTTDTRTLYRSNGTTWNPVGFYPSGTLQNNVLLYYNNTTKTFQPISPPAGSNKYLFFTGTDFVWSDLPINYQVLQGISVYNPQTLGFTFYNTIQEAVDGATTDSTILIPPGVYTVDNLTINKTLNIQEVLPGTVTFVKYFNNPSDFDNPMMRVYRRIGIRISKLEGICTLSGFAGLTTLKLLSLTTQGTDSRYTVIDVRDIEVKITDSLAGFNVEVVSAQEMPNGLYFPNVNFSLKVNSGSTEYRTAYFVKTYIYCQDVTFDNCTFSIEGKTTTGLSTMYPVALGYFADGNKIIKNCTVYNYPESDVIAKGYSPVLFYNGYPNPASVEIVHNIRGSNALQMKQEHFIGFDPNLNTDIVSFIHPAALGGLVYAYHNIR